MIATDSTVAAAPEVAAVPTALCTGSPHSVMVGTLAEGAAIAVGANPVLCRTAALFHDVGKVGIPDAVLNKPGKLTPEEFDVIDFGAVSSCYSVPCQSSLDGLCPSREFRNVDKGQRARCVLREKKPPNDPARPSSRQSRPQYTGCQTLLLPH